MSQISASELEAFLQQRHKLQCECCAQRRRTMAIFEPPNKVIIRSKVHGEWHQLTLLVTVPPLEVLMQLQTLQDS